MILAALAAAAVATPSGTVTRDAPMPNLYSQPAYCPQVVEKEVARQHVALKGRVPDGLQYALFRQLDGCSVPTPLGYHPAEAEGAKREDAPSNRR